MNSNGDGKPEAVEPDQAVRLLELELLRQRSERKQAGAPYRGLRVASVVFFFVVILGAMLAFYYLFYGGGMDDFRARQAPKTAPSSTSPP